MRNYKQSSRKINPKTLSNFFIAQYRIYFSGDSYVDEQAAWRLEEISKKSPECITNEKCKGCLCPPEEMVYENITCKYKCYPEWMDKKTWINFKLNNYVSVQRDI